MNDDQKRSDSKFSAIRVISLQILYNSCQLKAPKAVQKPTTEFMTQTHTHTLFSLSILSLKPPSILKKSVEEEMATISSSSFLVSPNLLQESTKPFKTHLPKLSLQPHKPQFLPLKYTHRRLNAVAEDTSVATADPSSVAARRLYVGNIPRTVTNDELQKIVEEHGAVEKAEVMYDKYSGRSRRFAFVTMKTAEDASAAAEKLNGTEIGGREVKVNITEKPLESFDKPLLQADDSQFVDSPHKVYVGNLAKTVTTDTLKSFFADKGKVLSAKVSRVPGTSKSTGYGFVTFSSEEDVEAAISSLNNAVLEGQKIRVNKA